MTPAVVGVGSIEDTSTRPMPIGVRSDIRAESAVRQVDPIAHVVFAGGALPSRA